MLMRMLLLLLLVLQWDQVCSEASESAGESPTAAPLRMKDASDDGAIGNPEARATVSTAAAAVVVDPDKLNTLYCTMEPVPVRCLIDRGISYVFPFECLLNRSSKHEILPADTDQSAEFLIASAPDPVTNARLPMFPLVLDHSVPRQKLQSCPCNCWIPCQSPASLMYEVRAKTGCDDCRCLSHDPGIRCECYDHYDLFFKDIDPHMSKVLENHVSRNKVRSPASRTPSITTTD